MKTKINVQAVVAAMLATQKAQLDQYEAAARKTGDTDVIQEVEICRKLVAPCNEIRTIWLDLVNADCDRGVAFMAFAHSIIPLLFSTAIGSPMSQDFNARNDLFFGVYDSLFMAIQQGECHPVKTSDHSVSVQ